MKPNHINFTQIVKLLLLAIAAFGLAGDACWADPLDYWDQAVSGTTNSLNAVIYATNLFVAVGGNGTILTSPNGVNWVPQTSGTTNGLAGVAYGHGKFVAVGANDTVLDSVDATNWTLYANATGLGVSNNLNSVCFGGGKFVATENNYDPYSGDSFVARVFSSADGLSWTQTYYTISGNLNSITYGNGVFAFLLNGGVFSSTDTTNWNLTTAGSPNYGINVLTFGNGQFLLTGGSGNLNSAYLQSSPDGTNWLFAVHFPANAALNSVCAGEDQFSNNLVAVMAYGLFTGINVGTSGDVWNSRNIAINGGFTGSVNAVVYGRNPSGLGVFVALGGSNLIYSVVYTGPTVWTNTAGGNWSNPANWSPNEVPGKLNAFNSPDDAQITAPGTYTVVFDEGASPNYWNVHSLTIGAGSGSQTLAITNKAFYVNPMNVNAGGVLNNSGSTLHAGITVANGGQVNSVSGKYYDQPFTLSNGATLNAKGDAFYSPLLVAGGGILNDAQTIDIYPPGSMNVAANGQVNLINGYVYLYAPMTNSGTININGNNYIYINNNGTGDLGGLLNQPGGVINLLSSGAISGFEGRDYLINNGSIVKSFSSSFATIAVTRFDNTGGTVTNLTGTLTLGNFTNTLAGTYDAESGATLRFNGGTIAAPLTPGTPLVFNGDGRYIFYTGVLDLPTDIIPNLVLQGGALILGSNFQGGAITNLALDGITLTNTLPVTGVFSTTNSPLYGNYLISNGGVWNEYANNVYGPVTVAGGGVLNDYQTIFLDPPGSMNIAANGQVNLINGYLYPYVPMTNSGTINIYGNNYIYIYNNGTSDLGGLLNQPGGVINLFYQGGISGFEGQDYLINSGSIIKSTYTGNFPINVSHFTNSGAITSQEGTLQLNNVTLLSSGSLGVSLNSASDYGKLSISGTAVLTGTFKATLTGSYFPTLGTVFNVLSYGASSGNFGSYNLPEIVTWQPQYNSTQFSLLVQQAQFAVTLAGNTLVFNANGGTPGNKGVVLTSTNVAKSLDQWSPLVTNTFDLNGHFNYTNAIAPNTAQGFFILKFQ